MLKFFLLFVITISAVIFILIPKKDVYVKAYIKSDGTYVKEHYRSSP